MTKRMKTGTPVKASVVSKPASNGALSAPSLSLVEREGPSPVSTPTEQAPVVVPPPSPPKVMKTAPVEEDMDPHDTAVAQLAMERVTTAQLTLQARQKELEGLLLQVKNKYEEGGRFALKAIDIPRGKITRQPR